jgi:beta-barrel assembly-enhancing protease
MSTRAWLMSWVGLTLAGGAFALDLDQLRRAIEKPKAQEQKQDEAKPAEQPAPAQNGARAGEPAADKKKNKTDLSGLLSAVRPISAQEEAAIGRRIAGNLLGVAPLVNDAKLQEYVNRVGRWVAAQSGRPDLKWTFAVIDSADINAFAAPGGYVMVTQGLYSRLQDESQLAGVLGHEIGHVQQKHHLKLIQQQQMMSAGSALLSKQIKGDETIQRLIGSGAEIMARSLDKNAEFEADRIGVVLAARAGYDPYGLPAVLQDIGAVSKDSDTVSLLFKTHPHPDERLAMLGEAMGERLDTVKGGKTLKERLYRGKQ